MQFIITLIPLWRKGRVVAVKIDGGGLAGHHLVGLARQGDEERLLLADEDLVPAASRFWKGRAFISSTLSTRAELCSGSDASTRSRSGAIARCSITRTPISTAPLSRGRLGRAGTIAHPQCSAMRRYRSLRTRSSTVFLITPCLRLSGAIIGTLPPKNENGRTWASTQGSSFMS